MSKTNNKLAVISQQLMCSRCGKMVNKHTWEAQEWYKGDITCYCRECSGVKAVELIRYAVMTYNTINLSIMLTILGINESLFPLSNAQILKQIETKLSNFKKNETR